MWLEDRPLAQLAVVTTTSKGKTVTTTTLSYLHTDHLDTPRFATNSVGTTVWRWEGEAFGDTAASEDPDGDGSVTTVNLRFPGQYYDQESGLHYNWNRYYDPKVGRYITSDPIGLAGGLNTYVYVENNPMAWIDPEGLMGNAPGTVGSPPVPRPPAPATPHVDYPRRAGLPPDRRTQDAMQCLANCLNRDLTVTGAREGGHSPGSAHETGQACDLGKRSNPGLERNSVERCFNQCTGPDGFVWGQEEASPPHYHIQTRPGRGGATGFAPGVR